MLRKNNFPKDFNDSNFFNKKTKEEILMDIEEGEYAYLLKEIDVENDWKVLEKKLKESDNRKKKWIYTPWLCALVVSIAVASYFMLNTSEVGVDAPVIVENNTIQVGTDKAILTIGNGEQVILEKGTHYKTELLTSNGQELVYKNKESKSEIVYNTLTIPRGGQYAVTLSDGTLVWLNSESQLKYPVSFKKGETREVQLIYGEAYFDVSPSTNHQGAKFKVSHHTQNIEVLGTEFNVKAYKDEKQVYTTLVEGKVAVSSGKQSEILKPNQQSAFDSQNNELQVFNVNVADIIAWKRGVFNFKRMPLKDIMKVLSRWYDMDVVFENKALEEVGFIGSFNKDYPIEDIMEIIKNTGFVKAYEIKDKKLFIK